MLLMYRSNIDFFFLYFPQTHPISDRTSKSLQHLPVWLYTINKLSFHQQQWAPQHNQVSLLLFFFFFAPHSWRIPSCVRMYRTLWWRNGFGKWLICQLQFIRYDYNIEAMQVKKAIFRGASYQNFKPVLSKYFCKPYKEIE